MLTERERITNLHDDSTNVLQQHLKSSSVEKGVLLAANNSSSFNVNKGDRSLFTSVHLTSSTQSDALNELTVGEVSQIMV